MRRTMAALAIAALATACSTGNGSMIQSSHSSTSLDRANFRVIKAGARGSDGGFSLFGFIPIVSPSISDATDELMAGVDSEGRAVSLTNVTQERRNLYLILFSLPRVVVRADIIEFLE